MSDFLSLLPKNSTDFEKALEQASAPCVDIAIKNYLSPNKIPENLIPWLAWEWSVDAWSDDWNIDIKRNVLRRSFVYHQKKGTARGVMDAIKNLGGNISINEWWQHTPKKEPFTFEAVVDVGAGESSGVLQEQLFTAIDNAKPVRSHYNVTIATLSSGFFYLSGLARVGIFTRLFLNG